MIKTRTIIIVVVLLSWSVLIFMSYLMWW